MVKTVKKRKGTTSGTTGYFSLEIA